MHHRLGMNVRRAAKSLVKTNLAVLSRIRRSVQGGAVVNGIHVLMYHRINDYRKNEMSVPVREFRKQVAWLKEMGFQNMRMAELESTGSLPEAPKVIFSFDDGYEDNYAEAFPVLKEFGYSAIFYIPYELIGQKCMYRRDRMESSRPEHNRIMDWGDVRHLHGNGMEIGSHTLSHPILTRMDDARAKKEIFESKIKVEERLGARVTSFCYPGGYFNQKHVDWVREAGYRSACTTRIGCYRGESRYRVPRIAVLASDSFFVFKQKMLGDKKMFALIH